ncbi:Endoribonuclease YSH1 like protein [Verticillium longisporum]|nr:Endoribonuclease YSH1 like protein [Verticillium longisporum]
MAPSHGEVPDEWKEAAGPLNTTPAESNGEFNDVGGKADSSTQPLKRSLSAADSANGTRPAKLRKAQPANATTVMPAVLPRAEDETTRREDYRTLYDLLNLFATMAAKRKAAAMAATVTEEPVDPADELMFLCLGGGNEVGRSCHIIQYKGKTVMLDAGQHPAYDGLAALPFFDDFDLSTVDVLLISHFTDVSDFPTANLKVNAGVSSQGLYHYPATITDTKTTKQVAKFAGGPGVVEGAAAVINNFDGREQFVWFTSWAPEWSATSNYLQHSHIHWMTRGLFLGKRKVHLSAQVDDLQLETDLYYPAGTVFKIRTGDLDAHIAWQRDINSRLAAGSEFWLELAHNGNGDIISATADNRPQDGVCNPNYAVDYPEQIDTPLEFQKPLGTGQDIWGTEFTEYGWSKTCAQRDEFASWFLDSSNLNAFAHLSHTFTHMGLNNATYKDTEREIQFNQAWMTQMGIDKATKFSPKGLVPPAITGMHNGDAIRAWMTNGITNVVGDNTRPPLRAKNEYWPLISNVADNGYDGLLIIPRYATTIYFNCDTAECTTREWIETSAGKGDFNSLLDNARAENTRHLLGLHADPYMFHQANMRQIDMPSITVGSQTGKMSLIMSWVETITQEMGRLTNWPITSLKHDDIGKSFSDRMALDQCEPKLSYSYSNGTTISSVTVSAKGNSCSVPVPVTIPAGTVTSSGAVKADQVGSEPPIQWVTLNGSPVTLNLGQTVGGA